MQKEKKLVLIGDSAFAEIAYEYFSHDSPYRVVGFSVEAAYLEQEKLMGLPVVPFEKLEKIYPPADHSFFVAATYSQMNSLRKRLYLAAKKMGYTPASYISSQAFVWKNCSIGEHCFIFEGNVVQPFVTIGSNVVLWSGNHIGHHSVIRDHCFIASHVVISGFCEVGASSFMGVNSTVANNLSIGKKCTIGAGALVISNVSDDQVVVGIHKNKNIR